MVRYGLSPLQAMQTATINAADLLSQQDKIGEIKAGAFADIIAVKGDPTKDVKLLQQIQWVMKDGKVWKNMK